LCQNKDYDDDDDDTNIAILKFKFYKLTVKYYSLQTAFFGCGAEKYCISESLNLAFA